MRRPAASAASGLLAPTRHGPTVHDPSRRGPTRFSLSRLGCAVGTGLLAAVFAVGGSTSHVARAADRAAQLAAPPTPLAAHRALYSLTLDGRTGGGSSDVAGASGTMGFEVINSCDGWATHQQLDMTVVNADGQNIRMVSDYTTWESKDGLRFRFHTRQTTDDAVTAQTDGDAKLNAPGGAGTAHYTSPKDTTKALPPGTLFPMAHTEALLAAARSGKKFIALPLFDGTSEDGAEDTSVVVLDWRPPAPTPYPVLSALPSTRVHLAFFERTPSSTLPDYEVSMRYWENGVSDNLRMDFGDFVMDAKLTDLKVQPHRC